MPNVQFESLTSSLTRLPDVIQSIPDIIREPAANPLQAAILLGIAAVLLLIVLMSIVLIIIGRPDDEEEFADEYAQYDEEDAELAVVSQRSEADIWLGRLTVTGLIIVVFAAVWAVAGVTTAGSEVCTSCHADSIHSTAGPSDPHVSVTCVKCHETGGPVARATVNLPLRFQHVILARFSPETAQYYGRPVASDGCKSCHSTQIEGVYINKVRGLRMSHKQPLAAGAQCIACHKLANGMIGPMQAGMAPCLRCHNGKVTSSDCKVCHIGDPGIAIVPSVPANQMASAQVPNPQCGGCHFDMTRCNNCHGISMPHSVEFKAYAHARPAAMDIWFTNSTVCSKCHYEGHNGCVQEGCHLSPVAWGHPNPDWAKMHQLTSWRAPKQACACHLWNPYDHNGMIYCQICHPVKPKNAIP